MSELALGDIVAARERIAGAVAVTPCVESIPLSEQTGCRVFCKMEYLQRTGSFKERGARNALMLLPPEVRKRGVIAASAGNHALALAYHGKLLGIPVTVVMPRFAPLIKVASCRRMGAAVELYGDSIADARKRADGLAEREGLTYVHGYDDPAVIAGQGTLGLEVLEQVPDLEAVVVPIGGAGLIAGVGLAVKSVRPEMQVFGVEPECASSYAAALKAHQPVMSRMRATLADGLAVPRVGALAFELAERYVDRNVTVAEQDIALAILRLLEGEKSVVEGAGAAPLAALLAGKLPKLRGKRVVLVLAGGNIDPAVLSRIIDTGLVADGRLCRFTAIISDHPGGLAEFAQTVASTGASIRDIVHDRAFAGPDVSTVRVQCTAETRDRQHLEELQHALEQHGIQVCGRGE